MAEEMKIEDYMQKLEKALMRKWEDEDIIRTMNMITNIFDPNIRADEDNDAVLLIQVQEELKLLLGKTWRETKLKLGNTVGAILFNYYHLLFRSAPAIEIKQTCTLDRDNYDPDHPEDSEEEDRCSVCLEDMSPGIIAISDCGHTFHDMCIYNWLSEKSSCPLCRAPVHPGQLKFLNMAPCLTFRWYDISGLVYMKAQL